MNRNRLLALFLAFSLFLGGCGNQSYSIPAIPIKRAAVTLHPVKLENVRTVIVADCAGGVTITDGGVTLPAFAGMRLRQGDIITTAADGVASLQLDGDKLITLEVSSVLSLDLLTGGKDLQQTTLMLHEGEVCNSVSKLSRGSEYTVKTANSTMGVRGTIFIVSLRQHQPCVAVVEGAVDAWLGDDVARSTAVSVKAGKHLLLTDKVWEAHVENPTVSVTEDIDYNEYSTELLGTVVSELEKRLEEEDDNDGDGEIDDDDDDLGLIGEIDKITTARPSVQLPDDDDDDDDDSEIDDDRKESDDNPNKLLPDAPAAPPGKAPPMSGSALHPPTSPLEKPTAPSNSDTPDAPDAPDEPDAPDAPDEPDTPDEPDEPDEPDAPDEPDK